MSLKMSFFAFLVFLSALVEGLPADHWLPLAARYVTSSQSEALGTGAYVGISIGGIVGVIFIIWVFYMILRK
ncbi:hypothetical protein GQ53DRAFT_825534 [Thozetella sp. PMI_491]|nr:hypothetical protein GQ53DRAFT_825534 [Thozetella sp. PMI_491]